nr:hypothetical protein [uncultured Holophaga sp.]
MSQLATTLFTTLALSTPCLMAPPTLSFPQASLDVPGLIARRLGLDQTQQANFRGAFERHRAALQARTKAFREARRRLVDLTLDARSSDADLIRAHQETAASSLALTEEIHGLIREVDPTLTPAQRIRIQEQLQEFRQTADHLRELLLGA